MLDKEQIIKDAYRREIIMSCIDILGRSWEKWGVEVVVAADKFIASTSYDPLKGPRNGYLYRILMNEINKTRSRNKPLLQLFDGYDAGYEIPSLVNLMKVDIQRDLGHEMYQIVLDKYGNGFSTKNTATRNKLTVEAVRWRLKKFDEYCKEWVND